MSGVPSTQKLHILMRKFAALEIRKGLHGMDRERFVLSWHSHVQRLAGEQYDAAKAAHEKLQAKIIDADTRGNKYLADANAAEEQGKQAKAEKLYAKGQYWLDRSNKLRGDA